MRGRWVVLGGLRQRGLAAGRQAERVRRARRELILTEHQVLCEASGGLGADKHGQGFVGLVGSLTKNMPKQTRFWFGFRVRSLFSLS